MAAGAAVAGRPPYQRGRLGEASLPVGRDERDHPCAGNLFAAAIRGTPLFALAEIVYQKSGLRTGRFDKNQGVILTQPLARRPARALSAGCLPSGTLIYERGWEI